MQFRQFYTQATLLLLIPCFLISCGDQKEASKAPVVSKKISVQNQAKPTKANSGKQAVASKKMPGVEGPAKANAAAEKRIYDPKERLNPFMPLFKAENKEVSAGPIQAKKRKKRIPRTPLERISLSQLKLVAIIRAQSGNRALVEDNSGKGFIIKKGTYIGLNSGVVRQINLKSVIVEEELENLMGEFVLQNTEIKLQKQAGE